MPGENRPQSVRSRPPRSRRWIAGLLNPKLIASDQYFGCTTRFKDQKANGKSLEMVDFVQDDLTKWPAGEVEQVVNALSAQAKLPSQRENDAQVKQQIDAGIKLIADDSRCASCHRFQPELPFGDPKLAANAVPERQRLNEPLGFGACKRCLTNNTASGDIVVRH